MSKKNEKASEYFTDEDYLDRISTASATDCTGLIQHGGNETDAASDYNELYQFGIPHESAKAAGLTSGKKTQNTSDLLSAKSSEISLDKTPLSSNVNASTKSNAKYSSKNNTSNKRNNCSK